MKSSKIKFKILFLGAPQSSIYTRLKKDHKIQVWQDQLEPTNPLIKECDLAICYGYRHILGSDILRKFHRPALNLHISYLPWNRGADPNLWSFLEKTPSGVTIHQVDDGIDTGPILAQAKTFHNLMTDTLATTYKRLTSEIENLLFTNLPKILAQKIQPKQQKPGGTFHKSQDKQNYIALLHSGWDTPVRDVWGAACSA